jgi:O-methyltransferase
MLGPQRLRVLRQLVEATLREGIPGDYIETGIWRGGACILMRAVLAAYGVGDRRVICADSFDGLPPPDAARYPPDHKS